MSAVEAIKVALDLLSVPSRTATLRGQELPSGVEDVLKIASGDAAALATAVRLTGHAPDVITQASKFYCQQILWHPTADPFRILGANRDTSRADIKRNMVLMMSYLHPDANPTNGHAAHTTRIVNAWNQVKTDERLDAFRSKRATTPEGNGLTVRRRSATFQGEGKPPRVVRANRFTRKRSPLSVWRQLLLLILGPMRR